MPELWSLGMKSAGWADVTVRIGQFGVPASSAYGAVYAHDHGLWFLSQILVTVVAVWGIGQVIIYAGNVRRDWQRIRSPAPHPDFRGNVEDERQ